tara:strand:- start:652 stop:1707 length:1056 start_codon:yes stop_codon:yes gene_type:complete
MTVRVTKPEFSIREKLVELDSPIGNHGSEIMRSESVAESQNLLQIKGRKNYFINGDCRIWQRGTSNPNVNNYGCDRWWKANGATQMDRDTSVPNESFDGKGFAYSMKVTSNGSGSNIGQAIELTDTGKTQFKEGKKYTMSFWAKADSGSGYITIVMYYRNSKFSGTNQVNWLPTHSPTVGTTDTHWRRYSYTFVAPPVNANNTTLAVELAFAATHYFTGFQFEEGSQATDFEHTNLTSELALCQRYFYRMKPESNFASYGVGGAYSSTQAVAHVIFAVPMRTTPTFSYNGNLTQYYDVIGGFSSFSSMSLSQIMGTESCKIYVVGSGTAGNPLMLATYNNTSTYFNFDAEL